MGALAKTDWTINIPNRYRRLVEGMRVGTVKLTVGDGIKTYPENGIPCPDLEDLGLHKELFLGLVQQAPDGYIRVYDEDHHSIRIFQGVGGSGGANVEVADHSHDLLVLGGNAPDEAIGIETTDGPKLVKEAATDRTIAGEDSATKGGVMAKTGLTGTVDGALGDPSPLQELAVGAAVAAGTFKLFVIGN